MTDDLTQKLARIGDRVAAQKAEGRAILAEYGWLESADAVRERFGIKKAYITAPTFEHGSPIFDGHNLMQPGCVWTVYQKPKKQA